MIQDNTRERTVLALDPFHGAKMDASVELSDWKAEFICNLFA